MATTRSFMVGIIAYRVARIEHHAAWPLVIPALALGLPLLSDSEFSYLISAVGWFLLAVCYLVWRLQTSRALGNRPR